MPRAYHSLIFKSTLVYFTSAIFIQTLILQRFSSLGKSSQKTLTSADCVSTNVGKHILFTLQENPYLFTYRNSNYSSSTETSNTKETSQV